MASKTYISTLLICLALSITVSEALNIQNVSQFEHEKVGNNHGQVPPTDQCRTAQLFQKISPFSLQLKDVSKVLSVQFSSNQMDPIPNKQQKVNIYNIKYRSKLLSSDQSQSIVTPLEAIISNDQTQFTLTYTINITERFGTKVKAFTATTKITGIKISYKKGFKLDTGISFISSVNVTIDPSLITTQFNGTRTADEQKAFTTAIKGTNNSLYSSFANIFNSNTVSVHMQTNCKNQHLSKIYPSNPYVYQYKGFKLDIDVSTLSYSTQQNESLVNGVSGRFANNKYCSVFTPNFSMNTANMYITKQFIQNFVQNAITSYDGWKNVRIDHTVESTFLQYYLLDLEYVVDGIYMDLQGFLQNQIYFSCNAQSNINTQLDPETSYLHQTLSWKCKGLVRLNDTYQQAVMDFEPTTKHVVKITAQDPQLKTMVQVVQLIDCQYYDVVSLHGQGKYQVKDKQLASKYIQSVFNQLRTETLGRNFLLNPESQLVKVDDNLNGIWII